MNNELCGFSAFSKRFGKGKGYDENRTVILPDYQGIGLGTILNTFCGDFYNKKGFILYSVTSNPSMISSRIKNKNWILTRKGRIKRIYAKNKKNNSINRITTSWKYINKDIMKN